MSVSTLILGPLLIGIYDRSFLLSQHNLKASRDEDNHEYLRTTNRIVSYIQSQEILFAEMNLEFNDALAGISNNLGDLRSRVEVATVTRTAQEVLRRDTEQVAAFKVSDGNLSYPGFFLKSKNFLQRNSAEAHFRIPFCQRKVVFQYQSSPHPNSNGFDLQLRTYNIVSESSPIFEACRNLDLPRVQELFQTRSASPFDFYTSAFGWGDVSIINEVLRGLVMLSRDQAVENVSRGLDLLKYLLPMFRDNPQTLNYDDFNWELADLINSTNSYSTVALVDIVRTILLPTKEGSFELTNLCFIHLYITLDRLESPMSTLLLEQACCGVDMRDLQTDIRRNEFWENDRLILADLEGKNMKAAIRNGYSYRAAFTEDEEFLGKTDVKAGFLELAHRSDVPELVDCCRNRLSILIQHEYGNEELDDMLSARAFTTQNGHYASLSLLQYALQLNMRDFLADILAGIGWRQDAINDIFDEELYTGIPELVDGKIEYQSQDRLREQFVVDLVHGRFLDVPSEDLFSLSCECSLYTGTFYGGPRETSARCELGFQIEINTGELE